MDMASLLSIGRLLEEPEQRSPPCLPMRGKVSPAQKDPAPARGACSFSYRGASPGCREGGHLLLLFPRAGLHGHGTNLKSSQNPRKHLGFSLLPKHFGTNLGMKTVMKPLNFGVEAEATVEAASGSDQDSGL